jgi:hypothetical protein
MRHRATSVLVVFILSTVPGLPLMPRASGSPRPERLIVHEWGTFTTVAGPDGRAMDWLPLGGPTDLPCFVHHYENRRDIKLLQGTVPLDYASARSNLWGKVRMETPVLYFYASRDTSVDVTVRFRRGLMTEWYPAATVTQTAVAQTTLRDAGHVSTIRWPRVTIAPEATPELPVDVEKSHYYAARATDAAPLLVDGRPEKFLFYRGVADFDVPVAVVALDDGGVRVTNLASGELPAVILFENRNGALGYRVHGALRGEATLAAPRLDGALAGLRVELERTLVGAGLYPKEAAAMVETWRDSWFEEGTRVFYILPGRAVDEILPLAIAPAPSSVARVFVGRMEVITPRVQRSVEQAIARNDGSALARHGRLLGAITERITAAGTSADQRARIAELTATAFKAYHGRMTICE